MGTNEIGKSMRRFVFRVIVIGGMVIILLNLIYIIVSWLFQNFFMFQDSMLRSEVEYLATLLVAIVILILIFIQMYRRRKRELLTLSEHIEKVAHGDFSSQIEYRKNDPMAHVFHDFNQMSTELASVQFLRKDFINNYSHEFKTPIASINGFASLLLERELPLEEQRKYLKIIEEESDRLSRLTSSTILLTKLSSQEVVSNVEEFDLGEQIRQCSIILSQQWLKKGITYNGELPEVKYRGNRELMQHLWMNLLGNAIKYTPNGGEISVVLEENEEHIRIIISDTGEGMDEDTLSHLFVPYYQGDSSHSNSGLGLGLSIVHQIVQLCEGTITVHSVLNEGSKFIIELPKMISWEKIYYSHHT